MATTAVEQKQLFINNEWRPAASGKTMEVDQSGDRRGHAPRSRRPTTRTSTRRSLRRARRSTGRGARCRRASAAGWSALGRPADGEAPMSRAARDAAQRQADLRVAAHRDPGGRRVPRVLRRLGRQGDGRDDPRQGQLPHLHAARAGRRRRGDRAVELPAAARGVEGRAGARVRQHRHPQAGEPDAADGAGARRDRDRGRAAAGRAERHHRTGRDGRPGASSSIPASTRSRSPATRAPARRSCAARRTR